MPADDIPSFLMQVEYDNVRLQDEFIADQDDTAILYISEVHGEEHDLGR